MAITLADFTKIWASTSPLTPYSFSDSNYQEGWNFVGATPPARQMWDSIQKQNDEKMEYIVDNFLPTAGGTMTGAIVGNPLTLTADDGNGNSADLVLETSGSLELDGNAILTNSNLSYNLASVDGWYIKLGDAFGGLIVQGGSHNFSNPSPSGVKNQHTITPATPITTVFFASAMVLSDRVDLFDVGVDQNLVLYLYQSNSYQFSSVTLRYFIIGK